MIDISVIALIIVISAIVGGTSYVTYRIGINMGYDEGCSEGYEQGHTEGYEEAYAEGYHKALEDVREKLKEQGIKMEFDRREE